MRIGIDVGGTNIVIGLVTEEGKIVDTMSFKTKSVDGKEAQIDKISETINEILNKNGLHRNEVEFIGIGVPGVVNYKSGMVYYCTNLGWKNFNLGEAMEDKTGIKTYIDNDATVAALAEYVFGSLKGYTNALMVTIGTGIGGGIIVNGKMCRGRNGRDGELGHIVVGDNFYECACGNNGCLETFCSATAIIKYAQKLIKDGRETIMLEKAGGNIEDVDAKVVFEAVRDGDKVAIEVMNRFTKYLGIGIANMQNLLDIEAVAIGGGVCASANLFLEDLGKYIKEYSLFDELPTCEVKIAEMKNDAGIIGAAMLDK